MIKITIKNDPASPSYTFFKKEVLIGSRGSCDLSIIENDLKPEHIQIEEEKNRFIIKNLTNDPFATLNDLPFGKRILKDQDVIQIGNATLLFEGELMKRGEDYKDFPVVSTKGCLDIIIDQAMQRTIITKEELHQEPEEIPNEGKSEMGSLLEEWKEVEHEFREKELLTEQEEPKPTSAPPILEQKQAIILDLPDEDAPPFKQNDIKEEKSASKKTFESKEPRFFDELSPQVKIIAIGFILALIVFILTTIGSYLNHTKESEKKVIQVARGVADIAVAMSYAKIHNITPQQHNWSNPQFLKSSIASSLSPYHFSNLKLEGNGKIHENYLLRIYTNLDNSRFIIIAQPESSIFHYFAIPDSIIVDSSSMNLHRLNDLKALNRLLIDTEQLQSTGRDEVAEIINNSPLIPIDSLADEHNANGFKTPERLNEIYPGAENFIYNSPRYSQVGEKIMSDALDIASNTSNNAEVRKMKELISSVAKLPATVIYTTKGKEHAQEAKTALKGSQEDLLIAYIDYDPKTHAISSTLIDHEDSSAKAQTTPSKPPSKQASHFSREIHSDPLYTKLNDLSNRRKFELVAIQNDLQTMIEKEIEEPGTFSVKKIRNTSETLALKMEELNITILKELHQLYGQHKNIPLSEFLESVERSGLRNLASNELFPNQKKSETVNFVFSEEGLAALNAISKAADFNALFQGVERSCDYLSSEQSEDPQLIMSYQNQVKGRVIEKLNEFILLRSDETKEFNDISHDKLLAVLKKAWIFDKEEQDFYIAEFILRQKSALDTAR